MSREGSVASCGFFEKSINSCLSASQHPHPPPGQPGSCVRAGIVFFTKFLVLRTGPDAWQAFSKYQLNEFTQLPETLNIVHISICLKCFSPFFQEKEIFYPCNPNLQHFSSQGIGKVVGSIYFNHTEYYSMLNFKTDNLVLPQADYHIK